MVVHIALPDADQDLSNLLLLRSSVPLFYPGLVLDAETSWLTDDQIRSFLWSDTPKVNGTAGTAAKQNSSSGLYVLY